MKKRFFALLGVITITLLMAMPCFAAPLGNAYAPAENVQTAAPAKLQTLTLLGGENGSKLLVDNAGLLSQEEYDKLLAQLTEISERQGIDVAVVTTNSTGGKDIETYADDFFDEYGYGQGKDHDGVMLVLDMGEREYAVTTAGYAITAFTDYGMEVMDGYFVPKIAAGNYYDGFKTWADTADDFITRAKNGQPVDVPSSGGNPAPEQKKGAPGAGAAGGAGLIGLLTAFGVTGSMRKQMKSVHQQRAASQYYKNGSMHVTAARDDFLYRNISRTPRPKNEDRDRPGGSTVHISSHGVTHGGHHGKF